MTRSLSPDKVVHNFPAEADLRATPGDRLFQGIVYITMLLEIAVFVEPAPVDAALVFCSVLGLLLGKVRFDVVRNLPLLALAVFALANLASMYDPADPDRAFWYLLVTLYLVGSWFFFVGLGGRFGLPMISRLIDAYCFAGLISGLIGIAGYFNLVPFHDELLMANRVRGLFKDPNVYGPYLVPVTLFALNWASRAIPTLRKIWFASLFLISISAIFLCFSRACWINLATALAVFFFVGSLRPDAISQLKKRIGFAVGVLALIGISVAVLLALPGVRDTLAARVTPNGLQNYDEDRFATQSLAIEAATQQPMGIGPGQSEVLFNYSTHSLYLRVLTENGVIGLIALLVFIGSTIARSITLIRHSDDRWVQDTNLVVLAAIVGHLVNSFVIDTVHWRHIWFIYALPWVSTRRHEWSSQVNPQIEFVELG
jgi:O-antigen ligase